MHHSIAEEGPAGRSGVDLSSYSGAAAIVPLGAGKFLARLGRQADPSVLVRGQYKYV